MNTSETDFNEGTASDLPKYSTNQIQLLVPIYNEGENVKILYDNLARDQVIFDSLKFIYDLDSDTSLPFIEEIKKSDSRVDAEKNLLGRGVINALKWGFSRVSPGPVIVLMGDNSDKLTIIPEMIELWRSGATVVSPSRYMKGGEQHGGGFIKSNLSRLAGKSLYLLGFSTSDPTNNFKLYDGSWLRNQYVESIGGFEVAIELCHKANKSQKIIKQLPTIWTDRTMGQSNFRLMKWLPHYLKWYFKIVSEILLKR